MGETNPKRGDRVRVKLLANVEKQFRGKTGTVVADSTFDEVVLVGLDDGDKDIAQQFLAESLEQMANKSKGLKFENMVPVIVSYEDAAPLPNKAKAEEICANINGTSSGWTLEETQFKGSTHWKIVWLG